MAGMGIGGVTVGVGAGASGVGLSGWESVRAVVVTGAG